MGAETPTAAICLRPAPHASTNAGFLQVGSARYTTTHRPARFHARLALITRDLRGAMSRWPAPGPRRRGSKNRRSSISAASILPRIVPSRSSYRKWNMPMTQSRHSARSRKPSERGQSVRARGALAALVNSYARAIDLADLVKRLEQLEERLQQVR
jgi:hypothetical protein